MKPIRMLLMFAVSMIVYTATATTAKLEQKQKAELVMELSPYTNAVSVVNDYQFDVLKEASTMFSNLIVQDFKIVNDPVNHFAIIDDVGWIISKQLYNKISYKEKLRVNYRLEIEDYNIGNSIRNNC